jgi:hypothetical protein
MNYKEKLFPRVDCLCGKTVYRYYLERHFKKISCTNCVIICDMGNRILKVVR